MYLPLNKAFTLIELLIVIGIIAILSGVLLSAINPIAQRNKATDAALTASVDKLATALSAYYNATGNVPLPEEFMQEIQNVEVLSEPSPSTVVFEIPGVNTYKECSSNKYSDSGNENCHFYYMADSSTENAVIGVKSGQDKYICYSLNKTGVIQSLYTECIP